MLAFIRTRKDGPMSGNHTTLRRTYPASSEAIWELWTTPRGIGQWWAPDGFVTEVRALDLRPGGTLVYTMTATAPAQVDFMKQAGLPLSTESRKTFTEVDAPRRLAYRSLVDFVPGHEPYEFLTVIDLAPAGDSTEVTMTMEPLHDAEWTDRLVAGRSNELDNLATVLGARN
jgi:uncharacterized protein YndB with AHSA1/START domain